MPAGGPNGTRRLLGSFGPDINDNKAYPLRSIDGSALPWLAVNTDMTPTHGTYVLDATRFGGGEAIETKVTCRGRHRAAPRAKTALCLRDIQVSGTLLAGQRWPVVTWGLNRTDNRINCRRTANGKFYFDIMHGSAAGTTLIPGATELDTDTKYSLRVVVTGQKEIRFWVAGVLQGVYHGSASDIDRVGLWEIGIGQFDLSAATGIQVNQNVYYREGAMFDYASAADRPGTQVESDRLDVTGEGTHDDAATQAGCLVGNSGDASDIEVDDWEADGQYSAAQYWCFRAADWEQSCAVSSHTPSGNREGHSVRVVGRAQDEGKTMDFDIIQDGDGGLERVGTTFPSLNDTTRAATFDRQGDGTVFDVDGVDNLEIGMASDAGNGTNGRIHTIATELCAVDDDGGPASILKPRRSVRHAVGM